MGQELCTLVVGLLTIESSTRDNIERPAADVSDTVQFWITPTYSFRVRLR